MRSNNMVVRLNPNPATAAGKQDIAAEAKALPELLASASHRAISRNRSYRLSYKLQQHVVGKRTRAWTSTE
jgi:hypothetical protein